MGRGHQGRSLRPFPVSQHHPSPTSSPPSPNSKQAGGKGAPGAHWPGGSAFVALSSKVARRQRGRGRRPQTLSRGLTPRCIVRPGPPPPPYSPTAGSRPGRYWTPSQRLPPPAAPTSRCPDQGPDVESSPQSGSGGAVHSAAPAPSSRRLTPPPGRTLGSPASCERVSVRRPRGDHRETRASHAAPRHTGTRAESPGCASSRGAGSSEAGAQGRTAAVGRPGSMPAQPR